MEFENRKIVAAFDFDGTLTYIDSFLPFCFFLEGSKAPLKLLKLLPSSIQYFFGALSRDELKQEMARLFLKGYSYEALESKAENFFSSKWVQFLIKKDVVQKLIDHKRMGDHVVIISANYNFLVTPFCKKLGNLDLLSTALEINSFGITTGKLAGKNCRGIEKVKRLTKFLGPKEEYTLFAYGDSAGDRELLSIANYPQKI